MFRFITRIEKALTFSSLFFFIRPRATIAAVRVSVLASAVRRTSMISSSASLSSEGSNPLRASWPSVGTRGQITALRLAGFRFAASSPICKFSTHSSKSISSGVYGLGMAAASRAPPMSFDFDILILASFRPSSSSFTLQVSS